MQRGPGLNDVGMVAWHMTLKTPECQQGRQVRGWLALMRPLTLQTGWLSAHLCLLCPYCGSPLSDFNHSKAWLWSKFRVVRLGLNHLLFVLAADDASSSDVLLLVVVMCAAGHCSGK